MTPAGFDFVKALNAAAHRDGTAAAIEQFENTTTHSQYRAAYDITAQFVQTGNRVLDWGCGNGHFSLFLEQIGARVTGYSFEQAPAALRSSATFTHVRGDAADPRTIPFADASFDCVCSVGVLEHVWETGGSEKASLAEINRILVPGGVFLTFHLPNSAGWIEPTFRALGLNKHFHDRKYDATRIRELWGAAQFDIVELERYNVLPRNQVRLLPSFIRHGSWFPRAYNLLDDALSAPFGAFATNFVVVGRKRRRAHHA